jgi:hypothetical protein
LEHTDAISLGTWKIAQCDNNVTNKQTQSDDARTQSSIMFMYICAYMTVNNENAFIVL